MSVGKFDGVLLASDFDGTLCDGATDVVPARSVAAIRRFMAEGGRFLVATGRAHRTFAPRAPEVPMNAPAVLSNGSAVYDFAAGEMLMQTFLRPQAAEDLAQLCRVFPELGFEAYFGEDIFVHNPNFVTEAHMRKVGAGYTACPIGEMPQPWTKVILQQSPEYLRRVQDYVLDHWGMYYECIFSSATLLEFTDKGSTKGQAVLWVARRLGIDPAHVYCTGDNPNDLPMLRCSAIPFVPANAAPEVLRCPGARLVGPCAGGAVADVIEALDERYE